MIRKSIEIAEPGGPRRLSYLDWGEVDNPDVVLCVHGLTRSARDFDRLAAALAEDHRVICADVTGRGESDWLKDAALYQTPTYARDMVALLDHLGVAAAEWIGTSMGGIISMAVAGYADRAVAGRIRRLVINDVGPFLPKEAIARIGEYVGHAWRWDSHLSIMRLPQTFLGLSEERVDFCWPRLFICHCCWPSWWLTK